MKLGYGSHMLGNLGQISEMQITNHAEKQSQKEVDSVLQMARI